MPNEKWSIRNDEIEIAHKSDKKLKPKFEIQFTLLCRKLLTNCNNYQIECSINVNRGFCNFFLLLQKIYLYKTWSTLQTEENKMEVKKYSFRLPVTHYIRHVHQSYT